MFLYERKILSSGNYGQEPNAEPEKHLLSLSGVEALLIGAPTEGVQKFRTP